MATYYDGPNMSKFLSHDALLAGAEIPSKCVEFYTAMGLSEEMALEPRNGRFTVG